MTDLEFDVLPLRVIRTCADGKQRYDPDGKRKLIEACRRPGASLAGLARRAGVNANQLRKWVWRHEREMVAAKAHGIGSAPPAFVPVVGIDDTAPVLMRAQDVLSVPEPTLQPAPSRPPPRSVSPVRLSASYPTVSWSSLNARGRDAALVTAMVAALGAR
jgi:transposase